MSGARGLNVSGGENRLRFENFSSRLQKVNVDVIHRARSTNYTLDATNPDSGSLGCYFQDELEQRKSLDTSSKFKRFYYELFPLVQSLPELLHHQKQVVSKLAREVRDSDAPQLPSFLQLISVLARDLQEDMHEHFDTLFAALVARVVKFAKKDAGVEARVDILTPEIIAKVFESMAYLIKYQLVKLLETPLKLSVHYGALLGHTSPFVREQAAKCLVLLIRKLKSSAFKSHMKRLLKAVSGNFFATPAGFVPISSSATVTDIHEGSVTDASAVALHSAAASFQWQYLLQPPPELEVTSNSNTTHSVNPRVLDLIAGTSSLVTQLLKGVRGCLHSKGGAQLNVLLELLLPLSTADCHAILTAWNNHQSRDPQPSNQGPKKHQKSKKSSAAQLAPAAPFSISDLSPEVQKTISGRISSKRDDISGAAFAVVNGLVTTESI